jgi:hypothetical protein
MPKTGRTKLTLSINNGEGGSQNASRRGPEYAAKQPEFTGQQLTRAVQ